ncbi:MAG: dehydrogenase [Coprococcus sp. CAG:131-related_45_246]|nr:MAG: dehydrogenase [Coprococcus sp. CAG:131-related_45_246]
MKNYNWAVLGTGVIANETAAVLRKNGRNLFAVGNEMFTDPDVDIIYITTPHNTHYGFIRSIL